MTLPSKARLAGLFVVTAGCLAYALWGVDVAVLFRALRTVRPAPLAACGVAIVVGFMLRVLRFQLLLGDRRPSFGRQVAVCGIGFLAINVVPLRLGEFVRPFMLLDDGIPWGRSLGAVAMERVVDLGMLLGMLVLVSFTVELPAVVEVRGVDVLAAGQRAIGGSLLLGAAGMSAVVVGGEPALRHLGRLPGIGPRLAGLGAAFREALVHQMRRPGQGVAVVALGVGVWTTTILGAQALLAAFSGLPAEWEVALTVTAVTVAGAVVIPTPGFFGPFEAFCTATLVLWEVDASTAAAFAVLWHGLVFGFHVVTGTVLLLREGRSLGDLVRGSRDAA